MLVVRSNPQVHQQVGLFSIGHTDTNLQPSQDFDLYFRSVIPTINYIQATIFSRRVKNHTDRRTCRRAPVTTDPCFLNHVALPYTSQRARQIQLIFRIPPKV